MWNSPIRPPSDAICVMSKLSTKFHENLFIVLPVIFLRNTDLPSLFWKFHEKSVSVELLTDTDTKCPSNPQNSCIFGVKCNILQMFYIVLCAISDLSWKFNENAYICFFFIMLLKFRPKDRRTFMKTETLLFGGGSNINSLVPVRYQFNFR